MYSTSNHHLVQCCLLQHRHIYCWEQSSMKFPYNKVHGANMGSIWGRQDPGGPPAGLMNFATWVESKHKHFVLKKMYTEYSLKNTPILCKSQCVQSLKKNVYHWAAYSISLYWLRHFCCSLPRIPRHIKVKLVDIVYLSKSQIHSIYTFDYHFKSRDMHGLLFLLCHPACDKFLAYYGSSLWPGASI